MLNVHPIWPSSIILLDIHSRKCPQNYCTQIIIATLFIACSNRKQAKSSSGFINTFEILNVP